MGGAWCGGSGGCVGKDSPAVWRGGGRCEYALIIFIDKTLLRGDFISLPTVFHKTVAAFTI